MPGVGERNAGISRQRVAIFKLISKTFDMNNTCYKKDGDWGVQITAICIDFVISV